MESGSGTGAQGRVLLAAAVLVAGALGFVWWTSIQARGGGEALAVAGNVRAESYSVITPALVLPTPDYAIGIPSSSAKPGGQAFSGKPAAAAQGGMSRSPVPVAAGVLASVTVEQGDRVTAGQVVAQIDPTLLDLGVEAAQASARRARADVGVIVGNLDAVAENQSDLASARTRLSDGEAQLVKARRQLLATRKQLLSARAKAVAGRTAIKKQIAALEALLSRPMPPTPPTATPGPTPAQILATLKTKLAELNVGIAKIDAGLAKIDAGLAKVNAGFGKLASARSKLNTGASALADAKTQLRTAKDVLGVVAEGRDAGVAYAKAARDAATITAPVDGVVTYARLPGTVAVVGAPIVRIAPDGPQKIDTYLTGEQLVQVRLGAPARVALDSFPGESFSARLSMIGPGYEFVPTSFPTDIVHMTRAVKVTLTLEESTALPAGTPVDLIITTRSYRETGPLERP